MKERFEIIQAHVTKRWLTTATMMVLLGGCMVGPDYQRPTVVTPDVFRGSPTPTPDAQSIADLKWFEVLKDEQLQDLIRTALAQNYDLRDAVARVDAARANLGITQADQYPKFGTGGGFSSIELSREGEFGVRRSIKAHRRSDNHDR
jgi:multidrug efflux system outer membrane protein